MLPKKASGAHLFFIKHFNHQALAAKYPDLPVNSLMSKKIEAWNALSESEKKPYLKMHEDDKKRYEREVNQLLKHGYFINADGVKSTEVPKKRKLLSPEEKEVAEKLKQAFKVYKQEMLSKVLTSLPAGSKKEANRIVQENFESLTNARKKTYIKKAENQAAKAEEYQEEEPAPKSGKTKNSAS